MKTYIYGLIDPNTKIIRYIGKSDCPKTRLSNHIQTSKKSNTHKSNWIKSLLKDKKKPEIIILEEVDNDIWEEREKYWIKKYKDSGVDVTNFTNGGEGGEKVYFISKEELYQKYIVENLSLNECKKIFNTSASTISANLKEYNIIKDKSVWQKQCKNKNSPKDRILERNIVLQYNLNGNLIAKHIGIKEASKSVNRGFGSISRCCLGKAKTAYGFIWKYEKDNVDINNCLLNIESEKLKKVYQYDLDGNFICEYKSLTEAKGITNVDIQMINKSCGGFMWKYEKIEKIEKYTTNKKLNPVIQYDLNGNFIAEFENMEKAARLTNSNSNGIYYACIGKYKYSNNYIWKFKQKRVSIY